MSSPTDTRPDPPDDALDSWLSEVRSRPPVISEKPPSRRIEPSPTREKPPSSSLTYLYTVSYLIFFSIFGTLARLGLQALTFYPGAPVVTSVLWANVGGSLLMGFFLEDKNIFREEWGRPKDGNTREKEAGEAKRHKSVKKTIPLYIGLTTGFCGSFTSFSAFISDTFLALSNDLSDPSASATTPRNGGYSFMAVVAIILTEVSLSMSALVAGAHLALALNILNITPSLPFRFTRRFLDPLFVFLAWGGWLGAVFMAIWPPDRHHSNNPGEREVWRGRALFAIVFAPLGCLLRFHLSQALNARIPTFPLGTFTANVFGSVVLAMCFDLQHVDGIGASRAPVSALPSSLVISCQVLRGVMDGFCGATTTVSTWVTELAGLLRRRYAYIYGVSSIGAALGFFVIIVGSLRWTVGFVQPVCE